MPLRSQAEFRYLMAAKGPEWMHEHGFDNDPAPLPERVHPKPEQPHKHALRHDRYDEAALRHRHRQHGE